jgi:hypothetical protein
MLLSTALNSGPYKYKVSVLPAHPKLSLIKELPYCIRFHIGQKQKDPVLSRVLHME